MRQFLIGYDRSVPKLRQAQYCVGCGKCLSHCPQRINIPEELQNDYPPQYDQNMAGIVGDPFMGDPFAQPAPQNPYDQDPFAADPFAADPFAQPPMGGNPYGGAPNPNDQGYNNGMM